MIAMYYLIEQTLLNGLEEQVFIIRMMISDVHLPHI